MTFRNKFIGKIVNSEPGLLIRGKTLSSWRAQEIRPDADCNLAFAKLRGALGGKMIRWHVDDETFEFNGHTGKLLRYSKIVASELDLDGISAVQEAFHAIAEPVTKRYPFDLDEWKTDKYIPMTRDGRVVEDLLVVTTVGDGGQTATLVGKIAKTGERLGWLKDGCWSTTFEGHPNDLMLSFEEAVKETEVAEGKGTTIKEEAKPEAKMIPFSRKLWESGNYDAQTRDGRPVQIQAARPEEMIEGAINGMQRLWRSSGRYNCSGMPDSPLDLFLTKKPGKPKAKSKQIPFSIEEWKTGKFDVATRRGIPVINLEIPHNAKGRSVLTGLAELESGRKGRMLWNPDGSFHDKSITSDTDLLLVPKKEDVRPGAKTIPFTIEEWASGDYLVCTMHDKPVQDLEYSEILGSGKSGYLRGKVILVNGWLNARWNEVGDPVDGSGGYLSLKLVKKENQ